MPTHSATSAEQSSPNNKVPRLARPPPDIRADTADSATSRDTAQSRPNRSVMAHSAKSPLFQSLEMLIEEQVGKSRTCPEGAGILRSANEASACRDQATGHAITGSGGEHWCVNCHAPGENLRASMPACSESGA